MVETPDIIKTHIPEFCNCCGNDISNNSFEFVGKRQIFDIPEINVKVTEYQVFL